MKFTSEQEAVISADPGQILVTAAAGSGKTTVLTERIIRRLGKRELDLRRVLVLTFTDAAAVSMRDKIEAALLQAREQAVGESRNWFNTQLAVLRQASVSTIHSFCFKLIRRYAHCLTDADGEPLLPLNPRVIQPLTGELIWTESVNAVLKNAYAAAEDCGEEDCDFYQLLDTYSGSRNDEPLRALMTDLHLRLRSLPDYREHCRRNLSDLKESLEHPGSGREYRFFLDVFTGILAKAEADLLQIEGLLNHGPPYFYSYKIRPTTKQDRQYEEKDLLLYRDVNDCLDRLRTLSQLCLSISDRNDDPKESFNLWNELHEFGQEFLAFWADSQPAKLRRSAGNAESTQRRNELTSLLKESAPADIIYMLTGQCSTRYRDAGRDPRIQPVFLRSAEEVQADIKLMLPALRELFRLTLAADETAIQTRQERGEIDFSDFEHYALQLLRQPEIRAEFIREYDEIYIDEYQDTSGIQEAILTATGIERIFRVGDIKQSIYRFRQARPSLFLDKLLEWSKTDRKSDGRVYHLNTNFRSRAGILAAINDIFLRLMTEEISGIDYSDGHALMPFRADDPNSLPNTRLILVTDESKMDGSGSSEGFDYEAEDPDNENYEIEAMDAPILSDSKLLNLEKRNKQIYITALEILRLIREENISFNDCAILVSTNEMLRSVSRFLQELHIPVSGKLEFDFRATWELRLMRSLISLLANQMQDIPLATAMLAPLYEGGFSEADLLLFRQAYDDVRPFHHAVTDLATLNPKMIKEKWPNNPEAENLLAKLQGFMTWLSECRDMCETRRIHEVLSYIFESRGFYRRLELSDGSITIFKEIAEGLDFLAQIEREGNYGIIAVDEYLSNHENLPGSIRMAIESGSAEEAVRVMTYHGSKGLEFPYVFLLQLDADFRGNQGSGHVIYNQDLRPGFDCRYPNGYTEWPSLHKFMVQAEEAAADLAERLRVLYVAMTRAEERLYLIGQLSRKSKGEGFAEVERLDETRSPRSLQDFILSALFEHRGLNLREWLNEPNVANSNKSEILVPAAFLKGNVQQIAESCCPGAEVGASDPDWNSTWMISLYALPESLPSSELIREEDVATPEEYVAERLSDSASGLVAKAEDAVGILRTTPLEMPPPKTYPYLPETQQALKLSISEIKRNADFSEMLSEADPYSSGSLLHLYAPVSLEIEDLFVPEEITTGRGRALRRGVVLHSLLEHIDIAEARKSGLASVNALIDAFVHQELLAPDELTLAGECAVPILNFVNSDLAATIIAADSFWREMPFTLALPNDHLYYLTKNPIAMSVTADEHDKTLVQGIIDLWYIEHGEAVIVDFKSDRLPDDPAIAELKLKERYLIQGQIYAWAVAAATGLPVRKFVIYSLPQNRAFEYPVLPIRELPD